MNKNTASAKLIFYNCSILSKLRGYNLNPPHDIVSIAPIDKEYKKLGRIWESKGLIFFRNEHNPLEDIASDFASKFGGGIICWTGDQIYNIEIPLTQRPIIIPAFVNYFSQNLNL